MRGTGISFLIPQRNSSCFKSFASARHLWPCFPKTFLCLNILRERKFFLRRVGESPSDRKKRKLLRMGHLLTWLMFLLPSSLLQPGAHHLQRTPHHCAFVSAVAFSFLCPAVSCLSDKAPFSGTSSLRSPLTCRQD